MSQSFSRRLSEQVSAKANPALIGIDPHLHLLPSSLQVPDDLSGQAEAVATFCRGIIDVVAPLVPALKFQLAFFEMLGPDGMRVLADCVAHARQYDAIVILDGKRNDIGSTAVAYAKGLLGSPQDSAWNGDALTVNPYLGGDSLQPFVDVCTERGCGMFVLVKTSNPGGGMFQDLVAAGRPIYAHVAAEVERLAAETAATSDPEDRFGAVGAVVGATYPAQLSELRNAMPHAWFLVPGFGSQGGTARDVAGAFFDDGLGAIVNSSRGVLFAFRRKEFAEFGESRWQEAAEAAAREMIDQLRAETPAGRLTTGR
ncbi:orotidine-5'-phosphate decarboxylase [Thermostilla marina]